MIKSVVGVMALCVAMLFSTGTAQATGCHAQVVQRVVQVAPIVQYQVAPLIEYEVLAPHRQQVVLQQAYTYNYVQPQRVRVVQKNVVRRPVVVRERVVQRNIKQRNFSRQKVVVEQVQGY